MAQVARLPDSSRAQRWMRTDSLKPTPSSSSLAVAASRSSLRTAVGTGSSASAGASAGLGSLGRDREIRAQVRRRGSASPAACQLSPRTLTGPMMSLHRTTPALPSMPQTSRVVVPVRAAAASCERSAARALGTISEASDFPVA